MKGKNIFIPFQSQCLIKMSVSLEHYTASQFPGSIKRYCHPLFPCTWNSAEPLWNSQRPCIRATGED